MSAALANDTAAPITDPNLKILGITTEEYEETSQDRGWLGLHRFGLCSTAWLHHGSAHIRG